MGGGWAGGRLPWGYAPDSCRVQTGRPLEQGADSWPPTQTPACPTPPAVLHAARIGQIQMWREAQATAYPVGSDCICGMCGRIDTARISSRNKDLANPARSTSRWPLARRWTCTRACWMIWRRTWT